MAGYFQRKKLTAGRDYIADNFVQPFCLTTAAKNAHMSPYHFLRVFKKNFGQTPNGFLIDLRMQNAKRMLITENMSISEVCEQVGYASLGSFSSLFMREVGMAPSDYRRKLWAMSAQPFHFPRQAIPACYAFHFLGKSDN